VAIKRVQKKIDWSPEDRNRHRAIRATFKGRPTIEELISKGELSGRPIALGTYIKLRLIVSSLKPIREECNLSLADVSERTGMDKAMLSRLENGHVENPGIETISRYLDAMNKAIEWRIVESTSKPKTG